jgi:uncharacterized protein (TIGR02145 family)
MIRNIRFGFFARLVSLLLFFNYLCEAQAVNDFGAISSGSWTTASIWRQWDGVGWNTIPAAFPNGSTQNVYILAGSTVTLPTPGPYNIARITVESGGKLFSNSVATNVYLNVLGSNIICNGEIGNGAISDGIAFNFEAASTTISGIGTFTASRFRKSAVINPTTALVIAMDVTLRHNQFSNTQLYNNTSSASLFNVTINAGYTLECAGSSTYPGNVSIDGINGSGVSESGGTITINGTLIVSGILYATTNNNSVSNPCNFTIGNGGVLKVNTINSPASGAAKMRFLINSGGKLDLTGSKGFNTDSIYWSTINNRYDFSANSTIEYSAVDSQRVLTQSDFISSSGTQSPYWNLIVSGIGTKTIRTGTLSVRGDITIAGQAVLDQDANDPNILVSGNWFNYDQTGFTESTNASRYVQFNTTSTNPLAVATITCPGGENFFNLLISKNLTNSRVRMQNPVTIRNQLTLGGASTFGILELNENTLTINSPNPAAIKLQGNAGYFRYIIAEDSSGASASRVNWNIGTSMGSYLIPFGINSSLDTIPFVFYKPVVGNIGTLSISTYGTPPSNLPWPSAAPPVIQLNSVFPVNNAPDNRDWTLDRFWYVGATTSVPGCSATFVYNNRVLSTTELPLNEPSPAELRAQYCGATLATWSLPQIGEAYIPFVSPTPDSIPNNLGSNAVVVNGLPEYNAHYTLTSVNSPLIDDGPFMLSGNIQNITCEGLSDGSIDITPIRGSYPISYIWNDGAIIQDRVGLAPGTYTVTATDALGSTATLTFSLISVESFPLGTPQIIGPNLICDFEDSIIFSVQGLTNATNFHWTWSTNNAIILSPQGNDSLFCAFDSLFESGQICVTVGNGGCNLTPVCNIVNGALQVNGLQTIIEPVTCADGNNGSIQLISSDSVEVNRNPGLIISEIHTDPAGSDSPFEWVELIATANINFNQAPYTVVFSNNGTATSKGWMQGGTPSPTPNNSTYAFLIDTGSVVVGEVVYVGGSSMTPAGKKLRVKNTATQAGDGGIGGAFLSSGVLGNGGGVADGVAVFRNSIAVMDSNSVPVDAVFFGTSIGVAALTDTSKGFTLPTNDLYSGGRLKAGSYLAPEPLGSYSLVANGAFNRANATFSTPRTFTTNTTTWSGALTGISLVDNQYVWSTGSTGSLITGLSAGTYSVTITPPGGSAGCTSQIIIPSPQPIVVSVTSPDIACYGDSVNVQVSASGGFPPYSGIGTFRLPSGSYLFIVTDVNGCTGAAALSLPQPNLLQVQASAAPILCDGGNTTVYLNAVGGVAPYTGLGPFIKTQGTYAFTITDAKGCSAQTSLSLVAPPPLVAESVPGIINCGGDSTTVLIGSSGGVSPYIGTGIFTVSAGPFAFVVSDANGCTATASGLISQPEPLLVTANGGSLSCNVGGAVSVSSSASGGIQPYQFLWSTGSTSSVANAIGSSIGLYTVTVTDAQGCIASDTAAVLLNTQSLTLSLSAPSSRICPNDSSASITSFVTGGEPPVQYLWSNGNQQANLSSLPPGLYTCSVTDAFGCTATSSFSIMPFTTPVIQSVLPPATNAGLPLVIVGQHLGLVDTVRFTNASTTTFSVSGDSVINLLVPSNAGSGPLTLIDSNGCNTNAGSFSYLSQFAELTFKLYIEGLYAGSGFMNLPLVNSGYASDAISVDTIEVLLHLVSNPSTIAERRKTVLRANGSTECTFPGYCIGNSYWVSIRHRNSVETWSKVPVVLTQQSYYNFSGLIQWPQVSAGQMTGVTNSTALHQAEVLTDGGYGLLARGTCWSTNPQPTVSLPTKTVISGNTGAYSSQLVNLQPNTTYYVRSYATNSLGTVYGDEIGFSTTNLSTDIDGNTYDTVLIGTQVWMSENLRVSKYRNGDPIPTNLSDAIWSSTTSGAHATYNNTAANDSIYGKLYNWYAVADPRGLCPVGWHVASDAEWTTLEDFLGGSAVAGGNMKAVSPLWLSPNTDATNSSGFTGLPGGNRTSNGTSSNIGDTGLWWSSTQTSTSNAWYRSLYYTNGAVNRSNYLKRNGFSVRCVRD